VLLAALLLVPILLYLAASNHILNLPKIRFVHSAPYVFAGLLATLGIKTILDTVKRKRLKYILSLGICILFIANSITGLRNYWVPELHKYEVFYNTYIPRQYFSIIDYLNGNSKPFSNVLANYAIGVYLPAFTKNNVFVGHMVSTNNFWSKYSTANSFFAHDIPEPEAGKLIKDNNISYILGEEKGLGVYYKNILKPVFSVDDLTLYTPVYESQ
jgi:hypothetical protein